MENPRPGLVVTATMGTAVVVAAVTSLLARGRSAEVLYGLWVFQNAPSAVLMLWLAVLVLGRAPGHGASRIFGVAGTVQALHTGLAAVADASLVAAGVTQPLVGDHGVTAARLPLAASLPLWAMNWLWVLAALPLVLLPLVFPDGRLPNRRWRWVLWIAGAATLLLVAGTGIEAWPLTAPGADPEQTQAIVGISMATGGAAAGVTLVAGVAAFVSRWRQLGAQPRFVAVGSATLAAVVLIVATYPWPGVWIPTAHVALNALIGVYGIAVARFRLHDLEPVLGKGALVAGVVVAGALAYLAVIGWLAEVTGTGTGPQAPAFAAIVLLAVLMAPALRGLRGVVDRLLYRRSADRETVITSVARTAASSAGDEEAVQRTVGLLLRGTGATGVTFAAVDGRRTTAGHVGDGRARVHQQVSLEGEAFGVLSLEARALADLTPDAESLLRDVARLLAVALHDRALAERIQQHVEELRQSRQRLVEAQDRARRDLERDLHDGAQADIVALRLWVETLRATHPGEDALQRELAQLGGRLDLIAQRLRDVARGVQPPLLEEAGVAAAVRAHLRTLTAQVHVVVEGEQRYPPAIERAAYFSCLEAVQNALRHARAPHVQVWLRCGPTALRAEISDDGEGFDLASVVVSGLRGLTDRVAAVGGTVEVESSPGLGTRVSVDLPAQPSVAAR